MEKIFIATGKTIDLAIESALAQLGLDRDSVSVQVLEQAKSGFLGIGAHDAKVQVTYEVPDPQPEKPRTPLSSASRSKPKAPKVEKNEEPKAPVAPKAPVQPREEKKEEPKKAPKPAKADKPQKAAAPAQPKVYAPAAEGSVEEKIEQFLQGLVHHMGSKAVPHAWKDGDNSYRVEFEGEDLGFLIGRRGETLDALQHLANYAVNQGMEGHVRIIVDAEQYRQKREDSLRRYAQKKAQQVLKARRRTTLEPMNAYERHIIHAALQDMENISTHSTGTEPNRRVVIEYIR